MNFIQEKLGKKAPTFASDFVKNLCLFYCYAFCCGIEFESELAAWNCAQKMRLDGILSDDGFVNDAEKLIKNLTGRSRTILKEKINSISQIKQTCPVCFEYNGSYHWVVVENGKIVFNSIENSKCVNFGKPISARIIEPKIYL
ncbi:hypothetical protein [Treponema pectinovorum]|uniref:hypothetical protein n=1 Tax=Treponema pectinovorum TaxID=164 RepID=UPI0011CB05BC|nr:hypothetical protein [Treponema pectinovorum]